MLFFYKFFFFGQIPFPGDLLVGNYEPYKSVILGVPHKGQGADVVRELYPWKYFSIKLVAEGFFPLWNPHVFSGNPHFGNLQSGTLYPVNLLFFIMAFIPAWSFYILLQYLGMLVFMYLYLRAIKIGKIPAVFGSVSFAFSSFMVVWGWYGNLGHSLMFLPLVLFSIEKFYDRKTIRYFLLLTFSFVLSIFAGYIQFTLYIYLLAFLYAVFRYMNLRKNLHIKTLLFVFTSFALSITLSAIQLIPLFELVNHSLRATYSYQILLERLMPPESVVTLLIPDFFGNPATMNYFLRGGSSLERASSVGLWPLIFVVFAVFSKKSFHKIFFFSFGIVSYLSTFSIPPIALFHSIGIPFLSTGIPTRILSVFCFCLAVIAALGMDSYIKNPLLRRRMIKVVILFFTFFILIFTATFYLSDPNFAISRRNMILPFGIFAIGSLLLFSKIPKKVSTSLIIMITIFELFYSFQKFNSFAPASYLYPNAQITDKLREIQGIDRYWGYGSANIDANFQMIDGTYTTAGYDALYIKRYGEFIAASKLGTYTHDIPRSVADIAPGYGPSELKENPFRQRALDLTGVRYVLNKKEDIGLDSAFDESRFALIHQKEGWQIYENKNAIPRIKLFGRYQLMSQDAQIIEKLYNPNFDYKNIVLLEEKVSGEYSISYDPKATVSAVIYTPNKISFVTQSNKDQLVFISDNYYPGWKAYVDDTEEPIYRANYTYRAAPVKKGTHLVEFVYEPFSFTLGILISGLGYICLIIIIIIVSMKGNHGKKK